VTHRVLVTGSRIWTDEAVIAAALREHWHDGNALLISGACPRGADAIAERIWRSHGGLVERHPAGWAASPRGAGFARNAAMIALGADVCLAFIRDNSPGASHAAALAERAGIPVTRYRHPPEEVPLVTSPSPSGPPSLPTPPAIAPGLTLGAGAGTPGGSHGRPPTRPVSAGRGHKRPTTSGSLLARPAWW